MSTHWGDELNRGAPVETRLARARLEERQSILAYLRRRAEDPALPMVQQVVLSEVAGAICRGEHYPRKDRR